MTDLTTQSDKFMADLRGAYRAQYEGSPELQAEFIEAADYAALKIAENPAMIQKMREHYEDTLTDIPQMTSN